MQKTYSVSTEAKPPEVEASNEIEAIHHRLRNLSSQFGMSADRTQRVVDRLCGAAPTPATADKPREVRSGTIGALNDIIDDMQILADLQSGSLNILDKLA